MEKITPIDIQHKSFKKALQGYDRSEVDAFLDEIIETLEDDAQHRVALEADIADLKERISHFKAMEESLQNTLVLAQRTADETKASAHKEADLIREKARLEAEREIANYNDAISEVRREHQRAVEANEKARSELRSLLMTHLSLVEKVAPPVLSRDAVPPDTAPGTAKPQPSTGKVNGERADAAAKPASKKPEPPSDDTTRITVY
ncbi:MAG: DivIVA domain-containing protein [Candidatus Tumulicola sp.]